MAPVTVTGFTAARTLEIEETAIVEGRIVGDNLVLTNRRGEDQTAGNVRGGKGEKGDPGGVWDATSSVVGGVKLAGNLGGSASVPKVTGALEATVDLSAAMLRGVSLEDGSPIEVTAKDFLQAVVQKLNEDVIAALGVASTLFVGTLAEYNALPNVDKNAAGFVGVIR